MVVWNPKSPAGRFLTVGEENVLLQQQYRDFLVFRASDRRSSAATRPRFGLQPEAGALRRLFAESSTRPQTPDPNVASDESVRFATEGGGELTTPHPLSKAAFLELGEEWPRWVSVPDLLVPARAPAGRSRGPSPDDEDEPRLFRFLLASYRA